MTEDPDPVTVADAARDFLEERDRGADALETVLEVDSEHETWTFDDLPLDSGTFGELVSRDIVSKVGGEYRVSSPRGVRAALGEEQLPAEDGSIREPVRSLFVSIDRLTAAALVGALALVAAVRLINFRSVFRERIVSPGNDPYHYRYWLEELLVQSDGIGSGVVSNMPERTASTRPLTHATNWFVAELLGGDQWAADAVAAWLPVVGAVVLGVLVYWLAVVVTDDARVAVASVLLLAVTPVHAVYTSAGFLEHRIHQYVWLGVTMLALGWLAADLGRRWDQESTTHAAIRGHLWMPWTWVAASALGIGLPFSAFAWGGSVLMYVPVAAYVVVKVSLDARAGLELFRTNLPLLVGLGLSGLVATFLHVGLGWHEVFVPMVALATVLGAAVVVAAGEVWRRVEWPVGYFLGLQAGVAATAVLAVRLLWPVEWTRLRERAGDLLFREGAVESASLFRVDNAIVMEPLAQIGLSFYLAVGVLAWACWICYRRYEPEWALIVVYGIFWVLMAALQVRFAGQLAIPFSVLGGFGLVSLLAWANLARLPKPFRERSGPTRAATSSPRVRVSGDGGEADDDGAEPVFRIPGDRKNQIALVWIVLLICGMSLIFAPSLINESAQTDGEFDAAMAIDDHALDTDRSSSETFVLSNWGDNRLYNYFVNGEADDYSYAYDHFDEFILDDDPDGWYDEFDESGVGYVVLEDVEADVPNRSVQTQMHDERTTGGDGSEPIEHYRAIHVDDDVTVYAVVPGATITTTGDAGEDVTIETETTVSGETIVYEREETVEEDGTLSVTVPYTGEYTVGEDRVDVSSEDVETGATIELE